MDPNAALQRIRELIAEVDDAGSAEEAAAAGEELAATVEGLDDWLCKGGAPPTEWVEAQDGHGRQVHVVPGSNN